MATSTDKAAGKIIAIPSTQKALVEGAYGAIFGEAIAAGQAEEAARNHTGEMVALCIAENIGPLWFKSPKKNDEVDPNHIYFYNGLREAAKYSFKRVKPWKADGQTIDDRALATMSDEDAKDLGDGDKKRRQRLQNNVTSKIKNWRIALEREMGIKKAPSGGANGTDNDNNESSEPATPEHDRAMIVQHIQNALASAAKAKDVELDDLEKVADHLKAALVVLNESVSH